MSIRSRLSNFEKSLQYRVFGVAVVEDRPGTKRILGLLENRRVPALGFRERRSWADVPPGI